MLVPLSAIVHLLVSLNLLSHQRLTAPNTTLHERFEQLQRTVGGKVGVVALHMESGVHVALNSTSIFPMQSVCKLPIAIALLRRVERGEIHLDDSLAFRQSDVRFQYSPLSQQYPHGGGRITVRQVVQFTIGSDGAASDIALRLSGGPRAVTHMLDSLGIHGIRIDRPELLLQADYIGLKQLPAADMWSSAALEEARATVPLERRRLALQRYLHDPRDTATPDALAKLWCIFYQGKALRPEMTALLADLLERYSPNQTRVSALLPIGTRVLQKTGTSGTSEGVTGTINTSALITLPHNQGHLVFVVCIKRATATPATADSAIAQVARAAYDTFVRD